MVIILVGSSPTTEAPKNVPTLHRAIEQLLSVKAAANLRDSYIRSLREYLFLFARGRWSVPIDKFTVSDIEDWFCSRNEAPSTKSSNLGRLSSLFSFAVRRGWIEKNPCDCVERIRLEKKPPRILSIPEVQKLLRVSRKEKKFFPFVILGLFAGLRPGEAEKLEWQAIDLVRGRLRIDASVTKVRRMRWVKLPENCIAWLKKCSRRHGKILPPKITLRRAKHRVRKAMGWKAWPQDILRHTAASYFIAIGDPERVARMLGTSLKILLSTYHELVTEEDGLKYSSILPLRKFRDLCGRI